MNHIDSSHFNENFLEQIIKTLPSPKGKKDDSVEKDEVPEFIEKKIKSA